MAKILIVDDDTEIRDLLEFDISSSGYYTDTAVDGKYVSAVSQTDGKITVTRADFPNVNVNKLFIAEGDTLVLNGGTALS